MGVLQDALPVVGDIHAQILLVQPVPLGGQVVGGEGAVEHPLLQLVAHHDMQAVGQLVRLRADEGRLGLVDHAVEVVLRHVVQTGGEMRLQPRVDDGAERPAAADDVLIEPGLALVDAHGHTVAQIAAGQLPAGVQLVQGVTALMHHGVQGRGHHVGMVVGGDTHIVTGEVDGEGMLRLADDAVVPVDAHDAHDEVGELPLDGDGEIGVERRVVHPVGVGGDPLDERHQLLPQGGEEFVAGGHRQTPLVVVQQRLVGGLLRLPVQGEALQRVEDLLQVRLKQGEIVVGLGGLPHVVGAGGQLLVGHELLLRDAAGAVVAAPVLLHLAAGDVVQLRAGGHQRLQHLHGVRRGGQLIVDAAELAGGVAADGGRTLGRRGDAVVVQKAHGVRQRKAGLLIAFQLFQCFGNGHARTSCYSC